MVLHKFLYDQNLILIRVHSRTEFFQTDWHWAQPCLKKKKQQKNMTTWGFHMKTKTARIDTDILTRNALAAYKCESTDTVLPVWHANVKDTDIIFRLHKTVPHSTNLLQILGWYSTKQCHTDHQLTTNSRMVLHKTVPHTSLIYYKF